MQPIVSIIICTRNRVDSLERTIQTIGRCRIPTELPVELVVVDNGSADQTRDAMQSIRLSNMPVRYFYEPAHGQSHARNRGLAEAAGTINLFTDDDVRVPPDWVQGMCQPILDGTADAIAGGVCFPPELDSELQCCRSWFASTEDIVPIRPDRFVGANMAFSRSILAQVPAFDPELGPGALGFGDDTLFCFQLRHAGYRLKTRFDVVVEHYFDISRLTRHHMLEMARQMGRSKAYVAYHWRHLDIDPSPGLELSDRRRLWTQRVLHPTQCLPSQQPTDREMRLIEQLAMREYHLRQSNKLRNYDVNGLHKINGILPAEPHLVR